MDDLVWRIPVIVVLIVMSGFFSGLTLGLLGLDNAYLQVLKEQEETDEESRKQIVNAGKIQPVRKNGNLLLTTLLIGNVAVNAGLSILLADLTSGLLGFVLSTALIVIFGEILPQAICSRYGLEIGANIIWFMKILIVLCYIISKPISVVLDYLLGDDPGTKFNKAQMKALFAIYEREDRLDPNQQRILSSVLDFAGKKIEELMTPLENAFMIDFNQELDIEKLREIYENGFSRVPVYKGSRENIVGILLTKDLMFVNLERLKKVWYMKNMLFRPAITVKTSDRLQTVLQVFKEGNSHIAIVLGVIENTQYDNYFTPVGIVTMEDIIECLIQEEIQDEHDVNRDNMHVGQRNPNLLMMANLGSESPSSEIKLICEYLKKHVEPFKPKFISGKNLSRLLKKSTFVVIGNNTIELEDINCDFNICQVSHNVIYTSNEVSEYFYMIIHGTVSLIFDSENIECELGPYKCLGVKALMFPHNSYTPDFTAVVTNSAKLLKISQTDYINHLNKIY